jgi:hypothetical protein
VDSYDGINEAVEQATGEYGVFFNELGKVVETGGWLSKAVSFNNLSYSAEPGIVIPEKEWRRLIDILDPRDVKEIYWYTCLWKE